MTVETAVIRTQAARPRAGRRLLRLALEFGVPLLLLAAWWFASANSTNPFFPPLSEILATFQELWLFDRMLSDVVPSMVNFTAGWALGSLLGVVIGTLLGLVPVLRWTFDPVVQLIRAIPAVALVPILVGLFGFENEVRIIAITLGALFPVLISTTDGVRSTDPLMVDYARVYRLTWLERLIRIVIPAATPQIFSGMLVSLQVAFIVMITSEMFGAGNGVGSLTLQAQKSFDTRAMWAGILLLGLLGYLVNLVFTFARSRALSWYIGANKAATAE